MLRTLWMLIATMAVASFGCAMCEQCGDSLFTTHGGHPHWQRVDPAHGRVGSVIEPAGAIASPVSEPGMVVVP